MKIKPKFSLDETMKPRESRIRYFLSGLIIGPIGLCFVDLDNRHRTREVIKGWAIGWFSLTLLFFVICGYVNWRRKIELDRAQQVERQMVEQRRLAEQKEQERIEKLIREERAKRKEEQNRLRNQGIAEYERLRGRMHDICTSINSILAGRRYDRFDRLIAENYLDSDMLNDVVEPRYEEFSESVTVNEINMEVESLKQKLTTEKERLDSLENAHNLHIAQAGLRDIAKLKMEHFFKVGKQLQVHSYLIGKGVRAEDSVILKELKKNRDAGEGVAFFNLLKWAIAEESLFRFEQNGSIEDEYRKKGILPNAEEMDRLIDKFKSTRLPCRVSVPAGMEIVPVVLNDKVLEAVTDLAYDNISSKRMVDFQLVGSPTFIIEKGALQFLNRCIAKGGEKGESPIAVLNRMLCSDKSYDEVAYLKQLAERKERQRRIAEEEAEQKAERDAQIQVESERRRIAVAERKAEQERARKERKKRFLKTGNFNY